MKLLVTSRDGSTKLLDFALPIRVGNSATLDTCKMWTVTDAAGTDYYFNKDDGTYDGWGRAVMSNEEADALLANARAGEAPPKIEVH